MDVKNTIKRCIVGILMMNISIIVLAQAISDKTIILKKTVISESTIRLERVTNKSGYDIEIITRNGKERRDPVNIRKGESQPFNLECTIVQANPIGQGAANAGGATIWNTRKTSEEWKKSHNNKQTTSQKDIVVKKEYDSDNNNDKHNNKNVSTSNGINNEVKQIIKKIDTNTIINSFKEKLDKDLYLSESAINGYVELINYKIDNINNFSDDKVNEEREYIKSEGRKIDDCKQKIDNWIDDFLSQYKGYTIEGDFNYRNNIKSIIEDRIKKREIAIQNLKEAIDSIENEKYFDLSKIRPEILINIAVLGLVILILIVWFSIMAKRKKNKQKHVNIEQSSANDTSATIVIRRKTTSILKKQSLEDVIDNKAYFKIESADFCNDSSVRRIYIKNTCIKDIYNMYADDLRNPNNPNEDGCMVLGRWVHDDQANEYFVSLEEIVRPGDDAVFQEYELNFGGKIKLKVAEKLRKLRRETNLQYDLTCWVHSHPGLGIFFSNSDSIVQAQLKHPSHPNFLIAIVVDILTPNQDFGIFTFKRDLSINSHNELKKIYSLEELYKWAVESDRNDYNANDYYNILSNAECVSDGCQSIQLSNGAIIDISSIITYNNSGLAGFIHGYKTNSRGKNEYIINSVSNEKKIPENELSGCLVIGAHCSIPSIRKAILGYSNKIGFVMFYSTKDETITTVPMIDRQLSMNEKYYSQEKLDDLKIWTRRKR